MPNTKTIQHENPLVQDDRQDTLLHASAVLHCLQHIDLKSGIEDEGELGINLILEMVRGALRYEALKQ